MELLRNLFEGYPNLWGGGVAHSVLILSLVIAFGIMLGKIKIAGISLGVTWILFVGIVFGHFNLNLDEHLLHFLKEFGLILFVYSIGLQVGPGFFSAFKKGGFTLNVLAVLVVFVSVLITVVLHFTTGIPITTMVGILSGAVKPLLNRAFVISRIRHHDSGNEVELVSANTVLHLQDQILFISNPKDMEAIHTRVYVTR